MKSGPLSAGLSSEPGASRPGTDPGGPCERRPPLRDVVSSLPPQVLTGGPKPETGEGTACAKSQGQETAQLVCPTPSCSVWLENGGHKEGGPEG